MPGQNAPVNLKYERRGFFMGMIPMWAVWLILAIIFLVVEALTLGLTTVWCAVGSLVAMVMDLFGASLTAQVVVMIIVSVISFIVCIIWIKPIIDRKGRGTTATNADRIIGKEGVVTVAIDPVSGKGQIKVAGQVWSAKSEKVIEEGKAVKVLRLEGVKAMVTEI